MSLRSLGRETLVYGLSSVLARLLTFLLLPFYTHYLSPAEYGVVSTLFAYLAFSNILYQYGMDQAYLRHREEAPGAAFGSALICLLTSSALLSSLLWAFALPLAGLGGLGEGGGTLVRYGAGILALDALASLPFMHLRATHRPWAYAATRSANIASQLALNILFVAGLGLGVRGVFLATFCSSALSLLLLSPVLARNCSAGRPGVLAGLLRYALPFVPAGLFAMAVQVLDRPLLLRLAGAEAVGVYQANYKLGVFMMLAVGMFDQAWRPFVLDEARKEGGVAALGRVLTYFLLGGLWLLLAVSLFIGELVRLPVMGRPLIHPDYWSGLPVVPVILCAYLCYGLYVNFMAPVILKKRSDLLVWATGLGTLVSLLANLTLIPYWGSLGSAWATLAAYAAMAGALLALGRPLVAIPYEKGRLLHLACVAAIVFCAAYAGRVLLADKAAWLALRLLLLAALPGLLQATGFFRPDESRACRELLGELRRAISRAPRAPSGDAGSPAEPGSF